MFQKTCRSLMNDSVLNSQVNIWKLTRKLIDFMQPQKNWQSIMNFLCCANGVSHFVLLEIKRNHYLYVLSKIVFLWQICKFLIVNKIYIIWERHLNTCIKEYDMFIITITYKKHTELWYQIAEVLLIKSLVWVSVIYWLTNFQNHNV